MRVSIILALLALPTPALGDAGFAGVGDLSGGAVASEAFGISGDGTVVVGQSDSANGPEAFRYTVDGGIEGLGDLPGVVFESAALDASSDGGVIVGGGSTVTSGLAFRWTEATGMVGIGSFAFPNPTSLLARGVSGDGSLVVGDLVADIGCDFTWTDATGVVRTCAGDELQHQAVADDGTVLGYAFNALGSFDHWAMRDFDTVPVVGNPFVNILRASLEGSNADASVLVGQAFAPFSLDRTEAIRWENSVETFLGTLGGSRSLADDVSADGSLVVGWADTASERAAFLWDATDGMRSLEDELELEFGLDLSGWTLEEARAISDDGNVVVGIGTNPSGDREGWIAVFETACSNGVDDDGDGVADAADFGCDDPSDLSERTPVVACDDGLDNDGDGLADFGEDPGCKSALFNLEAPVCQNGVDDDGDSRIDFDGGASANGGVPLALPDLQCNVPWRARETASSGCGLGGGALAGPLLGTLVFRGTRRHWRRKST